MFLIISIITLGTWLLLELFNFNCISNAKKDGNSFFKYLLAYQSGNHLFAALVVGVISLAVVFIFIVMTVTLSISLDYGKNHWFNSDWLLLSITISKRYIEPILSLLLGVAIVLFLLNLIGFFKEGDSFDNAKYKKLLLHVASSFKRLILIFALFELNRGLYQPFSSVSDNAKTINHKKLLSLDHQYYHTGTLKSMKIALVVASCLAVITLLLYEIHDVLLPKDSDKKIEMQKEYSGLTISLVVIIFLFFVVYMYATGHIPTGNISINSVK